jgi:hypothetical protein
MSRSRTLEGIDPATMSGLKRAEKQEDTRSRIAIFFVGGYLLIVLILVTLSTFAHLGSDTVKDYLLAVGSPLGFIIGFYFKSSEK